MASTTFTLQDADDTVCTYDMKVEKVDNRHSQLPLFGLVCCRFAVQPQCMVNEVLGGYLIYTRLVNGKPVRAIFWSSLVNFCLHLWCKQSEPRIGDVESSKYAEADVKITVDKFTKIKQLSNGESFCVSNSGNDQHHLTVLNHDDLPLWLVALEQHSKDHETWLPVSQRLMVIPEATTHQAPHFMGQRLPGTLYDEVSLIGMC